MMVSEYVTIDGKSYVTDEQYDKVLCLLKKKDDELYRLKEKAKVMLNTNQGPSCFCENKEDYVSVALALETLAYHSKIYLDATLRNENTFSREIQKLLRAALD